MVLPVVWPEEAVLVLAVVWLEEELVEAALPVAWLESVLPVVDAELPVA